VSELYDPWCKKFNYSASDALKLLTDIGYNCYSMENNKLIEVKIAGEDDEKYNYFFLHKTKHEKLIGNLT